MERSEVVVLLTKAGQIDGRKPTPERVEAWHDVLGSMTLEQASEALAYHHRTNTEYVQPAHLVTIAKLLAERRADEERRARARIPTPPPPKLSAEELAEQRELHERVFQESLAQARAEKAARAALTA